MVDSGYVPKKVQDALELKRYFDIITALDEGNHEVTKWEADFIESVLHQGDWLSSKQKDVIIDLGEKYGITNIP
jgi:hypothetical protein